VLGGIGFGLVTAMGGVDNVSAVVLVAVVLGVVAVVALIYFGLPVYLLTAEIAYSDEPSPMQLLKNCYTLADGERWSIFGVGLVAGLVIIAGVLACCVGVFPALAMAQLLITGLYLSLRNGAQIPEPGHG
jgi:hypothetical protein